MTNHRLSLERDMSELRIGVGLPAAIPEAPGRAVVEWAARAEELDFASLGVIDRLVYDNQDPLVALAAAAAVTERAELVTTVLNVPWRQNSLMLAKQMASLDRLSGGRLVAGLGLGGWPEDYRESGLDLAGRGPVFDAMLDVMGRAWAGQVVGAAGPMPGTVAGRPELLFGGFAARSFKRAAALGTGWVAPLFGHQLLVDGIARRPVFARHPPVPTPADEFSTLRPSVAAYTRRPGEEEPSWPTTSSSAMCAPTTKRAGRASLWCSCTPAGLTPECSNRTSLG